MSVASIGRARATREAALWPEERDQGSSGMLVYRGEHKGRKIEVLVNPFATATVTLEEVKE